MANDEKRTKATAIIWLSTMKEAGRRRLRQIHASGCDTELADAQAKQDAICLLLDIVTASPVGLEELLDHLKALAAEKRQGSLFTTKNPV